MGRRKMEPLRILCLRRRHTEIVHLPVDDVPNRPDCGAQMVFVELLDEGKFYCGREAEVRAGQIDLAALAQARQPAADPRHSSKGGRS